MVGNGSSWNFPDRKRGDRSRHVSKVFLWRPRKTNQGWRWLCTVNRVSTIEEVKDRGILMAILNWIMTASTVGYHDEEIIRYEVIND